MRNFYLTKSLNKHLTQQISYKANNVWFVDTYFIFASSWFIWKTVLFLESFGAEATTNFDWKTTPSKARCSSI